jgi:hypothetical protein
MTASVPLFTIRTISSPGTMRHICSAISTSRAVAAPKLSPSAQAARTASRTRGSSCPRSIGPHEHT